MLPENGTTAVTQRDGMLAGGDDLVQQLASGGLTSRLVLVERGQFTGRQSDADVEQEVDTGRSLVEQSDIQRTLTAAVDCRTVCQRVEQ